MTRHKISDVTAFYKPNSTQGMWYNCTRKFISDLPSRTQWTVDTISGGEIELEATDTARSYFFFHFDVFCICTGFSLSIKTFSPKFSLPCEDEEYSLYHQTQIEIERHHKSCVNVENSKPSQQQWPFPVDETVWRAHTAVTEQTALRLKWTQSYAEPGP